MKKFLKLFKKKKIQFFIKNYKYIYLCRISQLNKKKILNIFYNNKEILKYNLKLKPILTNFSGQGSILCLCFNDYNLVKILFLKKTFFDLILVKSNSIFSENKLNKIFNFNNALFLNLFIIKFIFIYITNKINNYFLLKNIIFCKYLKFIKVNIT